MGHRLGLATMAEISAYIGPFIATQLNSTSSRVELSCVAINGPYVAIFFCRHCSVPVPCKNGSVETTVAEGGRNLCTDCVRHHYEDLSTRNRGRSRTHREKIGWQTRGHHQMQGLR